MKTLIFIIACLLVASCTLQRPIIQQRFISTTYIPYVFPVLSPDTIYIYKSDRVAGFMITVPEDATDTTWYTGGTETLSGVVTGWFPVAPGSASKPIGYNSEICLDSVRINVKSKAYIEKVKAR